MKVGENTALEEAELDRRRREYDQVMAKVMAAMSPGPDREWWMQRNEVERTLTVPVDVFRTWYHYETGRLEAARSFLERRGLAGRLAELDVLDVGCGYGGMLIACAQEGARVWGVEPSPDAAEWAARRLETHGLPRNVQPGTAEDLPHEDQSMDVVLLTPVQERELQNG